MALLSFTLKSPFCVNKFDLSYLAQSACYVLDIPFDSSYNYTEEQLQFIQNFINQKLLKSEVIKDVI